MVTNPRIIEIGMCVKEQLVKGKIPNSKEKRIEKNISRLWIILITYIKIMKRWGY